MPESDEKERGYGWSPEVQRKVTALCLRDRTAWGQLGPQVFDARWVSHPALKPVAEVLYRACQDNGGVPPSPEVLEELVRERVARLKPMMADAARKELALVLTADLSDARMVRVKAAEWARTEAVVQATLKAAEMVDRGAVNNGRGGDIVAMFQDALAVGKGSEACLRLVGNPEAVEKELAHAARKVETGFPQLDHAMGGGAEPGLHVVAGDPKLGKTSFLTQVAVGAARRGLTVWYVSGEVAIRPMARRFVSAMTGWSKKEIREDPRKALVRVSGGYGQARGEIILEYVPGFRAAWMASRLRQLESQGDRIGLVVVDYVDLMRGREQAERRFELAEICQDLRALAVAELGVPFWTAKSVNRKAVAKEVVTKADLAECFDVAYIADNIFALCATEAERRQTRVERDGRVVKMPVIRLFYAAGRENEDEFLVGAWERDNDRQRWKHLPGYIQRQAEGGAISDSTETQ